MVDRFDPPRDLDWKPLPMRPDIAGQYVRYSDLAAARAEIERLKANLQKAHEDWQAEVAVVRSIADDNLASAEKAEADVVRLRAAKLGHGNRIWIAPRSAPACTGIRIYAGTRASTCPKNGPMIARKCCAIAMSFQP